MAVKLLIAALLLSACAGKTERTSQQTPPVQATDYPAYEAAKRLPLDVCELDGIGEPLLCGALEVFENRAAQEGRKIPVSVVVIPAARERNTQSAWIEHQGGPRYSMIGYAGAYARGGELEWFRQNRDVVLIDPRGLHESYPLYCDALKYPRVLERYYPPDRVRACREELESIADVSQYSTINAVDDIEDIRKWLGYEKWDVGGWSFGSRFMLTYLHRHPDSIRSIALSFPAILNFQRPLHYARFGQQAFNGLVEDCAADAGCSSHFPDPAGDLHAILDALEAKPLEVRIKDPDSGEREQRLITRDVFAESVWTVLLYNNEARHLPFVLHRAAAGDFTPFLELVAPPDVALEPEPEGHYFAVVCPEETAHIDMEMAIEEAEGTFVGPYIAKDYIEACAAWGAPTNPDHPIKPQRFDTPALIFTGDRDPVTQPEYGDQIAEHFTNARHIVLPRLAHGVHGDDNADCYSDLLDAFVTNASPDGLDTSCLADMLPPPFRLE